MQTVFAKARDNVYTSQIMSCYGERILSGVMAFIISGASIMSAISPFGVAWIAAVPEKCTVFALAGSIFGYLTLSGTSIPIKYLSAIIIMAALKWAFSFLGKGSLRVAMPAFAGVSLTIAGLASTIPAPASEYLLVICEAAVGVTSAILFGKGYEGLTSKITGEANKVLCSGIVCIVAFMGLKQISFMEISPAGMVACWALFVFAYYSDIGTSTILGAVIGIACVLVGEPYLLVPILASSICVAVFSPLGKLASVITMLFIYGVALLAYGQEALILPKIVEILTGAGLFLITPVEWVTAFNIMPTDKAVSGQLLKKTVSDRLEFTCDALDNIADVTVNVSRELDKMKNDPLEKFVSSAIDTACKKCIDSPRCWQTGYLTTKDAINKAFLEVRGGLKLNERDIPEEILCRNPEKLALAINDYGERYVAMCNSKKHSVQLRNIAGDQFSGMSILLKDMEQEVSSLCAMGDRENKAVVKYLEGIGVEKDNICCAMDINQRVSISVVMTTRVYSKIDVAKVTVDLSEACVQELAIPIAFSKGEITRVKWRPKAIYTLECGFLQRAARAAKLCGDSVSHLNDNSGRGIMLLSDGMGVGGAAAVDSALTTSLLGKLLKADVSFEAALKLVNCSLLSCSEERLCTIDAGIMDLYTGRFDFYKAGAATSFVIRKGRVAKIENSALPAGILGGVEAKKTSINLNVGDIVVMMSDGVTDTGDEWIPSQLVALATRPIDEICKNIMETAKKRQIEGKEDDMSVMIGIVKKDW